MPTEHTIYISDTIKQAFLTDLEGRGEYCTQADHSGYPNKVTITIPDEPLKPGDVVVEILEGRTSEPLLVLYINKNNRAVCLTCGATIRYRATEDLSLTNRHLSDVQRAFLGTWSPSEKTSEKTSEDPSPEIRTGVIVRRKGNDTDLGFMLVLSDDRDSIVTCLTALGKTYSLSTHRLEVVTGPHAHLFRIIKNNWAPKGGKTE